jgi:hypothetical protein
VDAKAQGALVKALVEAIGGLATSVLRIAHGGVSGPTGLEMLSMSISGEHNGTPLGSAIQAGLESGAGEIAEALRAGLTDIAQAIESLAPDSA